ncbi:MAG: TIGR02117 family protein, partial [Pseudomonadota bacterium]|nr:TIGR02117 family protein [Pseudomonadota bacterium]
RGAREPEVRTILRWLRLPVYLLAALVAVVLVYLGATYVGAAIPARPTWSGGLQIGVTEPGKPVRIYLLTTLLHADFAIPVDDELRTRFAFLGDAGLPIDNPALEFLVFGWGSRAFYTNTPTLADIRLAPTLRAVTGDRSVMHVLPARNVGVLPDARALELAPGAFGRLVDFIEASFDRTTGDGGAIDHPGYGYGDVFYAARGGFDILRPCNIWVARGLREAGLSTGAWTPTTHSLMLGLSLHAPAALVD